ncbi:MAG: homoserine kinase [Pseudomonadales bacterium]|nr:homoserine kinase [Pseudomonadales bacterium]
MAIITPLSRKQVQLFLLDYPRLGQLVDLQPTEHGIENTNYFVSLQRQGHKPARYVLTLFEQLTALQWPFYNQLLQTLAAHGLPVPAPMPSQQDAIYTSVNHKPMLLFPRFTGKHPGHVNTQHCEEIGLFLGHMHGITSTLNIHKQNSSNLDWMHKCHTQLRHHLSAIDLQLLESEIAVYHAARTKFGALPAGIIHADLFRDNALFEGNTLTGVIDFYNACSAPLLYDLAVVANDWCRLAPKTVPTAAPKKAPLESATFEFSPQLTTSLLKAYSQQRSITEIEKQAWPLMCRFAACRFWLSRLLSHYFAEPGKPSKDPAEFRRILLERIETPARFVE